ncbi:hypothetical protein HPT29_017820 [Microvirga terrae]|uniref:Uncharacterized protein n=1 Tax=Microvirga terrae TaxID=2740529 RepID=A0ABY5RMZ8_9HYPH|nr:hypothetical protein [Microvirga terrae]UVF18358.1 hypothetical protein HPT29_017820 [Microvirga terrae]
MLTTIVSLCGSDSGDFEMNVMIRRAKDLITSSAWGPEILQLSKPEK